MSAPDTLGSLLERAATRPDVGLRLLDRGGAAAFYPWPEVHGRAAAVAGGLTARGVRPGDRVALVFPTSIRFVDALFGVVLAGAVPVPLYPPVRLHRLEEYVARTGRMLRAVAARLVLADSRVRPLLAPAVAEAAPGLGCLTLDGLEPVEGLQPAAAGPGDLALVQFSSGTTVDPKPVALSHRAVVRQAVALNGHWPDVDGVVNSGLSWLPLYHDMGLIGCVITALERPGTMTLIPPELFLARPGMWLRAISDWRATISVAPNFAYGLCADRITDEELDGVDLSGWRVALCGAEPVVPRVLRRFVERFAPWGLRPEALTPVYGLSEATLAVTFSDLGRPFASRSFDRERLSRDGRAEEAADGLELACVGRPIDGAEVRVVDGGRRGLPDGVVGDVLVRSPSLMEGYFGRPEATREVLADGWLDTGDLGFVHHGELYLTGRRKDVLILRGRCHSPTEVEAAVDEVDGVRRGCSVAVSWLPDGADGERLLVLLEARRGLPRAAFAELVRACRARVRRVTGLEVDRVEVLAPGTLPRTSSGKLRRQEALRRLLAGELEPPRPWARVRAVSAALRGSLWLARVQRGGGG